MPELQYREALLALQSAFQRFGKDGVIIGGVAVGLLAVPRYTKDIDALIMLDIIDLAFLVEHLKSQGFEPLFSDAIEFARTSRILALRHEPSGARVDIALGSLPLEEEIIDRSVAYRDGDLEIKLPTPEDLIILKAIANRGQDREDIRTIAEVNRNLDTKRIRQWIQQYGELLDTPDLWQEIEPLLTASSQ